VTEARLAPDPQPDPDVEAIVAELRRQIGLAKAQRRGRVEVVVEIVDSRVRPDSYVQGPRRHPVGGPRTEESLTAGRRRA
jgi:hypothetical protein